MMTVEKRSNTLVEFDPFAGDIIEKIVPATESQKEIFASCVLGGENASLAYNLSLSLHFTGRLNENALQKSVAQLHQRHESLRATFTEDGTQMIIYESKSVDLLYQNLEAFDKTAQQDILEQYHGQNARTPFDLFNGPLTRLALFRFSSEEYLLTITVHHIICDGWSLGILLEDLSRLYNAACSGQLPAVKPLLFSDYVIRSVQYEQSEEYREALNYWKKEYQGNVPAFEIPSDFPRPARRTYTGTRQDFILPAVTADKIKKIGARYGSSFVNTLMSVFEILLSKYSGSADVVIGLPTAGQAAKEMYDLIGHCVNFLPLRSQPRPEQPFSEYLKQRKSKTLVDYEHQQFTFGTLLKELKIDRDPSRIPLTPMSFNIDIGMNKQVTFDNLSYKVVSNKRVAETFEIFLNITDREEGYEFQWSYNTQLFKPSTIEGLMQKYEYMLQQISMQPEVLIADIKLVNEDVVLSQLGQWNQTSQPLPGGTFVNLFESIVRSNVDGVALKFQTDTYTYKSLNESANRLAHYLISQGVKKGDTVGVVLERSAQVVVVLLGVLKCGASYLPIDPEFPEDRISFMLEDSGAPFVVTSTTVSQKLSNLSSRRIHIDQLQAEIGAADPFNPEISIQNDDQAYILYTSGSTGKPKGVMVSHENLLNFLLGMKRIFNTGTQTKLLSVTTISFDIAGLELYLPLISGGRIVLADANTTKSSKALIELLSTEDINMMQATPATYKIMLQDQWPANNNLVLLCGGEALSKNMADALLNKCGRLFNMYGPTETTIWSTVKEMLPGDAIVSIGKPIQNTTVYILDKDNRLLPPDSEGEIFIGGKGVALGYHNRADLTRERFIPDTFSGEKGARLYKTGDLGRYLANGDLICLGRSDNQAKIRGYRIELGEIEHYISKIEGIKDAVVKVEDGETDSPKLVAYIVPSDLTNLNNGEVTKDEVLRWRGALSKMLPDYMLPNLWLKLKEFPLTPNKKIDRNALHYAQAAPAKTEPGKKRTEALTALISEITTIWEEEIGIKGIEPDDNFFELGGHSMIAVKVMNRVSKQMNTKLPIASLFEYPTIASLSKLLDDSTHVKHKSLVAIKTSGSKPPIYLIHGGALNIFLYKNLEPFLSEDQPLYGIQALGLDGDLSHLDSIESIVNKYLEEVLAQNPEGPYILIGYSYGGIIAFEMARQLIAMGKEIKMVGIMDTNVSERVESEQKPGKLVRFLNRQAKKTVFFGGNLLSSPREVLKYQWTVLNKKLNKNFKEAEDEQIYDYPMPVIEAYDNAYCKFILKPLDVKVHLFRVKERTYYVDDRTYLGWLNYARKGVAVYDVRGDHKTFILPPHNEHLIKMIEKIISTI
ncbi:non-ribosomal peptide synthetase [Niabella sp. CJ426]|uniref:non-ribosomal peptide synthetase n=1 Tax=Niabella sp. CJ426 TaxID=3393740 RepID=UPI003D08276E